MPKTKKKLELPQIAGYTFDKENHVHALDGKPLTGVTTVLGVINKPMLIQWAANMACDYVTENFGKYLNDGLEHSPSFLEEKFAPCLKEARTAHRKKKEAAGDHGTEIHSEIESLVNKAIEMGTKLAFMGVQSSHTGVFKFVEWAINNDVKFLASEKNIYSRDVWVGGIADIVCEIDGKRYVGDIKTSSGIYPEHFIQASAYAAMLKEMKEYDSFDGVVIIHLKKDGGFDIQYNYDLEGNFNCFKSALNIYRHLNSIK